MQQPANSSQLSRVEILRLPYGQFMPGRRWTPTFPTNTAKAPPLVWTTVLVPQQLEQIESPEEYLLLLTRRVEWLIEQMVEWKMTYEAYEELEAKDWVAQEINQYLPMYMNSINQEQSPHQMASYLVMNYQELQRGSLTQQFPVSPYPMLETGTNYLEDMNLIDWLMFMNMDAKAHYFQD